MQLSPHDMKEIIQEWLGERLPETITPRMIRVLYEHASAMTDVDAAEWFKAHHNALFDLSLDAIGEYDDEIQGLKQQIAELKAEKGYRNIDALAG